MNNPFEKLFSSTQNNNEKKEPVLNRRDFLKKMGAGIVGMGVLANAETVEAGFKVVTEISNEAKESKSDLLDSQIIAKAENPGFDVEVTPEYKRNLKTVLLTVPEEIPEGFDAVYGDLLKNLPEYAEIQMVVKESQIPFFQSKIKNNKLTFLTRETDEEVELWSQDYGEAIKIDGKDAILLPGEISENNLNFLAGGAKDESKRYSHRYENLRNSLSEDSTVTADFFFEGGNMTFDKTDQGLRVFVGYTDIVVEKGNGKETDKRKIAEKISRQFGGAEVVVMGDTLQEKPIIHIDQSFIVLDNKTVVMNQYDDANGQYDISFNKIKAQHEYYQAQLEKLGYTLILIKNSVDDAKMCKSSVNAVPYVDENTGEKKVLFPVFPGELKGDFSTAEKITPELLTGKALDVYKAFLKAGYIPVPVRDSVTHTLSGNTHCITNVLAKFESNKDEKLMIA